MFDLGWTELMVIGIVALIVVGPKDLPKMFRQFGRFTGKAKAMARDFSKAMNDAADDSGVNDISSSIKAAANPASFGADKIREAVNIPNPLKPGGETEKLSKERKEAADKIRAATAKAAEARKAKDAADAAGETVAKAPAKKAASKKAPAKAATAKAAPAKAAPAKEAPAKKPAAKKVVPKKAPKGDAS
jgi:sec-independent protein translocase protein TatB